MNEVSGQQVEAERVIPVAEALALADRLRREGRLSDAEALCRQILAARSDLAEAEHLLGLVAHHNGKLDTAIKHLQRATELAPSVALFHANLGEMQRLAGRPRLAVASARQALTLDPKMASALSNMGVALYELKDYAASARAHREAIAAQPDFAEAYSNLGNALHALRAYDEAIEAYRRALALKPDYADALANLGTTLHHSGSFDEAIATLRYAIALAPHHANAHSGLGILLLMRGDLAEGWEEYEWRLRSTERFGPRFPERPWQGESLDGRHIYVQAEQGLGDTLQFARYLPLLAAHAGGVTLRVHQQVATLLRESLPGVTILGDRGDPAPYDCDAALLSLPRLFKTRLETIPATVPYLRASPGVTKAWRTRFAAMKGLKVGIVWAGNPEHANDARRSLDLAELAPILTVPGVSFVSLQVGKRSSDLKKRARSEGAVRDLSPALIDFEATAGAICALDLVLTVDTSVAHLAGGLGKPVWVLLPWVSDWRWMLEREDNPWYPTMRLFRQAKDEDWPAVIGRVASALSAVSGGDTGQLTPFAAEGGHRAARAAAIIAAQASQARAVIPLPLDVLPTGQKLVLAEQKRRHNFLGDADELARGVVAAEPNNAEAFHTLGLIAHQSGKLAEAIEHLHRAATLSPDVPLYHANLGEMYRMAGNVDEAIASGRRALALNPDNPAALSNLGIALFDQGKFVDALTYYERAIELQPDFAQAHSNRGNALQRLKRFAEAEPAYRRALEIHPEFADGWNNLGTCLRELGRLDEAETAYRKALELQPNNPEVFDNLALAFKDSERLDEAAEWIRRALVIDATRDAFFTHYAAILLDQEKHEQAADAASRALALNPTNCDAINQMGRIAAARGDLEGALGHYQRALVIKPDLADACNNMGNVLKELGRLDEAQRAYLEAIRFEPTLTGAYVNLADSKIFVPGDPHLAAMEALAAKTDGLSRTDRIQLGFALGKAYGDIKDHRRAFRYLREANAAKRAAAGYDEAVAHKFFERIEATFTTTLLRAKEGGGDPSAMPIFVIGMPRSGTTLIEQILASHPTVRGAGELKTLGALTDDVRDASGNAIPYPEFVPLLDGSALRQIGERYLAETGKLALGSARVTDKMPSNYYMVGLIHLVLPNARIVHCIRDPIDTCLSCFSKLFAEGQPHTYDLGELGRYYRRYQHLMAHWRRVLPANRMLDIRYEDVVADLEGQARRLLSYCNLPWDDRCLTFHQTARPVRTASATQVRHPIYNSAIGRWRNYKKELRPLITALGL
jgi:tetratricopeptide (TPR) repeat protein